MTKYGELLASYNRRAKGRDYKVLYGGTISMKKAENGDLTFHRRTMVQDATTTKWVKKVKTASVFVVHPDNTLEVTSEIDTSDMNMRNIMSRYFRLRVFTDSNRYGSHKHKVRVLNNDNTNFPFAVGTVIHLASNRVVTSPPDERLVTNRKASQPIYEYAKKVLDTMFVLKRVGAFDDVKSGWGNYRALSYVEEPMLALLDDNVAELAELTYKQAYSRTNSPTRYRHMRDEATGRWSAVEIPAAQQQEDFNRRLRANAQRHLLKLLKEKNGGYDIVEITNN